MKRPVLASVLVVAAAVLVVALISTRKEQAVEMNMALIKAIAALVPAGMLFAGSVVLYCRSKSSEQSLTTARSRMSGDRRSHSCVRSACSVSLDALGAPR
jgi:hypothetical protein